MLCSSSQWSLSKEVVIITTLWAIIRLLQAGSKDGGREEEDRFGGKTTTEDDDGAMGRPSDAMGHGFIHHEGSPDHPEKRNEENTVDLTLGAIARDRPLLPETGTKARLYASF